MTSSTTQFIHQPPRVDDTLIWVSTPSGRRVAHPGKPPTRQAHRDLWGGRHCIFENGHNLCLGEFRLAHGNLRPGWLFCQKALLLICLLFGGAYAVGPGCPVVDSLHRGPCWSGYVPMVNPVVPRRRDGRCNEGSEGTGGLQTTAVTPNGLSDDRKRPEMGY